MIGNQWYVVYAARKLKRNRVVGIKRLGENLVLWRNPDNSIGCVADKCCHRGASLSQGLVKDNHIQCPFHGIEYSAEGQCILIPANGKSSSIPDSFHQKPYATQEKYGFIWIFWGDKKEVLPEIPFFENISPKMHYVGIENYWKMHYTRCIENQLDVLHLPFVHRTTIGKGNSTVINGPNTLPTPNGFDVYLKNEVDTGQKPLKPAEMPPPLPGQMHLEFMFPNLWQNYLSKKLRIFISFTPIDEENTLLFLRMYQKIVNIPLLQPLVDWIMMKYNLVILNQDKRVVLKQLPPKSGLKMDERLLMADQPIIKYRQIRQQLLDYLEKGI